MSDVSSRGQGAADKLDENQKKYRSTDKGKQADARYKGSEKGKEAVTRYRNTDSWYLTQKKYRLSLKGKEALERQKSREGEFKLMMERREQGLCLLCGSSPNGIPLDSRGVCSHCNEVKSE